ncbi:MAG: RdgB/HAM1 family non-canonical purine NTP pyrophosphatase [Armatimonadetes bacterium]|nr:RdgB/HAM1 family non-canonical purine NTP pyrophosphatase [Armatimonadota bacterium]
MTARLLLATSNPGKVVELRALLSGHSDLAGVTLLTPLDLGRPLPEVAEIGTTFAENARIKALALANASGLIALADDSGLCVDALGGDPGVRSARWAGPTDADRAAALLERLRGVPASERMARFVCAACAAAPGGALAEAEGVCEGMITEAPRGRAGFGYDPVFLLPAFGRTMAELSPDEKNRISHRARAIAALTPRLRELWKKAP